MKFTEEITVDWYDNILKSFCTDETGIIYYCCLLALNRITNEKVYLCVDIKYLKGYSALEEIIKTKSFRENWNKLPTLIDIKNKNEVYLIKAKDLRTDQIRWIPYKSNFIWPKKVVWGEYPELLAMSEKIDNWWKY